MGKAARDAKDEEKLYVSTNFFAAAAQLLVTFHIVGHRPHVFERHLI